MEAADFITPTSEIVSLEDGFSAVKYSGDYKLDEFLEQGGASFAQALVVSAEPEEHCFSSGQRLPFFMSEKVKYVFRVLCS